MDKALELLKRAWNYVLDNPGAVLTGVIIAVVALVILRVGSFLAGIGG